jgi:hypothetical protein
VPHDDFAAVRRALDHLWIADGRPAAVVNFTGGNKLMATAAFQWARERALKCFYLERGFQFFWFDFDDRQEAIRVTQPDLRSTHALDPLALVRCHVDASEVEREGQMLRLSAKAAELGEEDFWKQLPSMDRDRALSLLDVEGTVDEEPKQGDALELIVALALLRLGVPRVRRSLRLKVQSAPGVSARRPHAEIDLLFNWGGRLWLVDCKDRKPIVDVAEAFFRASTRNQLASAEDYARMQDLLRSAIQVSDTKVIKEDLLAVREIGGLLGETVCVRRTQLNGEVRQFARRNRVRLIESARSENNLRDGLWALLRPDEPASEEMLAGLTDLSWMNKTPTRTSSMQ